MRTPPKAYSLMTSATLLLVILASFNLVAQIETDAEASIIGWSFLISLISIAIAATLVYNDNVPPLA